MTWRERLWTRRDLAVKARDLTGLAVLSRLPAVFTGRQAVTDRDDAVNAMDTYAVNTAETAAARQKAEDQAIIDDLTAQLRACRGSNTFGMAVGPPSGVLADDLSNFKAVVANHPNLGIEVRRSYTPGTKTTWVEPLPGAGILPFFSQKPDLQQMASGSLDGWAGTFAQSCPDGAYLTIQHEPENPGKNISGPSFVAGFDRWAKVTKQANPNVKVGPVYMEWQMRKQGAAWSYGNVTSPIDFWGFDAYVTDAPGSGYLKTDSAETLCTYAMAKLDKLRPGLPFVVAEIGLSTKLAQDRVKWLNTARTWAKTANTSLLYYDAGEWMLTDAEMAGVI